MKKYAVQKVDTRLYVAGFSGAMVYSALYGMLGGFVLFVVLYILAGTFVAVGVCVPGCFAWLYHLNRIQKKYGSKGWHNRRIARQLPEFILIKGRICQS